MIGIGSLWSQLREGIVLLTSFGLSTRTSAEPCMPLAFLSCDTRFMLSICNCTLRNWVARASFLRYHLLRDMYRIYEPCPRSTELVWSYACKNRQLLMRNHSHHCLSNCRNMHWSNSLETLTLRNGSLPQYSTWYIPPFCQSIPQAQALSSPLQWLLLRDPRKPLILKVAY